MRSKITLTCFVLLWAAGDAAAATPSWGSTVAGSVVFDSDLVATAPDVGNEFYGLIIGADGTTIDLNGFAIDGASLGGSIYNPGFDNVTIRNGTIIRDADGAWMDGLYNRSVSFGPGFPAVPAGEADGVDDLRVENVVFRDQAFNSVLSAPCSRAALWCDICQDLVFQNNEIDNGGWLWMLGDLGSPPVATGGTIVSNRWHDNDRTAILLWNQRQVTIERNLFESVNRIPPCYGPSGFGEDGVIGTATGVDGLVIRRNVIRDSGSGSAGAIDQGGTSEGLPAIGIRHRDALTTDPADHLTTIEENCIMNNAHGGIHQFDGRGAQTVEAHGNDLIGNGSLNDPGEDYGVRVFNDRDMDLVMNATDNFWGLGSGPISDGAGLGNDAIVENTGTGSATLTTNPFATVSTGMCADRDASGVPDVAECGTRYYDPGIGFDEGNTCLSPDQPCATLTRALAEACPGDLAQTVPPVPAVSGAMLLWMTGGLLFAGLAVLTLTRRPAL